MGRLLRARRERPRRRTAEQRDELAPFHSIDRVRRPCEDDITGAPSLRGSRKAQHSASMVVFHFWGGDSAG
jgi:hypothetical protein